MKQIISGSDYKIAMKNVAIVTEGELNIVKEMASGKSADEIAKQLKRSLFTIQTRIYRIRKKTGFRKNTLLIAAFKDQGLI